MNCSQPGGTPIFRTRTFILSLRTLRLKAVCLQDCQNVVENRPSESQECLRLSELSAPLARAACAVSVNGKRPTHDAKMRSAATAGRPTQLLCASAQDSCIHVSIFAFFLTFC